MKNKIFFRNCPNCSKEIGYANKRAFFQAEEKQQICMSCAKTLNVPLNRNCPQCDQLIFYTKKGNRQSAEKNKTLCVDCGILNRRNYEGENNPFYGKHHNKETIELVSFFNKNIRVLSPDVIQKLRENLSKHSNKRWIYDIWVDKYGLEEANKKLEELRKKRSEAASGEKNPMFGKPTPQGSGNGWSGWYNNWYFRSLRELSYMINIIEKNNLSWKTPDKSFRIKYYDFENKSKTYLPDFIINNHIIVEIKPQKLHNSPKVLAKKNAAEEFCNQNNMIYQLIDPEMLSDEFIKNLYLNNKIKFLDKYKNEFKERYLKC